MTLRQHANVGHGMLAVQFMILLNTQGRRPIER